jgi:hypothetical protein
VGQMAMDEDEDDPREGIEALEERIERLAAKIENCSKFILASRVAIAVGGVLLVAIPFGIIGFDATVMAGAIVAVLGGIVLRGSNGSTEQQALEEMRAAEAERARLIGLIELHVVSERPTLH